MLKKPKKLNKKVMKDVFDGILSASQKEIIAEFPELRASLVGISLAGPESYYLKVAHKFEGVVRDILAEELDKEAWGRELSRIVFIYSNYQYVENNILNFIVIKEGTTCSADKSRWLVKALARHYIDGGPIDMTIDDKCYWKPGFWTSEQWIELFEALVSFYYGDFNTYMLLLRKNWLPELQNKGGQYEVQKAL